MSLPERKWLEGAIAKGLGLYAVDKGQKIIRESFYTIDKSLKTLSPPAVKAGLSVGLSFVREYIPEPLRDVTELSLADATRDVVALFVDKTPFIVAISSSEIEFYNFDPSEALTYAIDGVTASTSTDANGYAKVTLSTPLSSGKHNVTALSKTKATSQIVVV